MTLETKRLILRPWTVADAVELYKYASDPRVGPDAGWPVHKSVDESRKIIETVLSKDETYAVVLKETGTPVGCVGIMFNGFCKPNPLKDKEAELGYWIGVPYWGNGFIPEACECLIDRCFSYFGLRGVYISYFDFNEKSRRVAEKLGFNLKCRYDDVFIEELSEKRNLEYTYLSYDEWKKRSK